MGLDLPSGGHLTHGYYTYSKQEKTRKAVSATSIYFESLPYRVNPTSGLIDYDALESQANLFKPAMIICGHSAYPAELDYERFHSIAQANGSLLMMDMAHISGLVATGQAISPFQYCDIVTTTTHKTLRGPRAGLIFYRKDERDFETKISMSVFPGLQGGPHIHQIAAIATQLKNVQSTEFQNYAKQIRLNSSALARALLEKGYTLATGGTVNHLLLWDLRTSNLTGSKMQTICDACGITLNKNTVPGDVSALTPGGVRIGSPALTTRGLLEDDFYQIAEFLDQVVKVALRIQETTGKTLAAFKEAVEASEEVKAIRVAVMMFITRFPMPGYDVETMKYKTLESV
jgi:glycine hydroxymethyltransferase